MSEDTSKLEALNKYTNIRLVLDSLNNGGIIRGVFGNAVKIYAVLIGIVFLGWWLRTFTILGDISFLGGIALLIWQLFFPVAGFLCLKAIFLRGSDIKNMPDSEFIISPIIALFITLHGEIAFIFLGVMSIPATLLFWLGASSVLPVDLLGDGFIGGIVVFVASWVAGFCIYCISRFIREWTMALFSIARNVDIIKQNKTESKEHVIEGNG